MSQNSEKPRTLAEMRADFQHLRRWRKSVEQAQSYIGAVWLGIKVMLGK
jgi:hypothetical protein